MRGCNVPKARYTFCLDWKGLWRFGRMWESILNGYNCKINFQSTMRYLFEYKICYTKLCYTICWPSQMILNHCCSFCRHKNPYQVFVWKLILEDIWLLQSQYWFWYCKCYEKINFGYSRLIFGKIQKSLPQR